MLISIDQFCKENAIKIGSVLNFIQNTIIDAQQIDGKFYLESSENQKLLEGEHYVVCKFCKRKFISMSTHISYCFNNKRNIELKDYKGSIYSNFYLKRKKKTEAQKLYQSNKLKERFQTPEGEITRQQISNTCKQVFGTDQARKEKSIYMRKALGTPEYKQKSSDRIKLRWKDPEYRAKISRIAKNSVKVQQSVINARQHMKSKFTKPHQKFKKALIEAGIFNFTTELLVDFYCLDEGDQNNKICIEIDGCYFHGCSECGLEPRYKNAILDKRKTTYLTNKGWTILRFPEHRINKDLDSCIQEVQKFLERQVIG
jgi:very-short-patch-repair endonuclease